MKNSGNIRLIEDKELVTEMLHYYEQLTTATQAMVHWAQDVDKRSREHNQKLFNYGYFMKWLNPDTTIYTRNPIKRKHFYSTYLNSEPSLELLSKDPIDLKIFLNLVIESEKATHLYISYLQQDINAADTLIKHIQQRSNFKKQ